MYIKEYVCSYISILGLHFYIVHVAEVLPGPNAYAADKLKVLSTAPQYSMPGRTKIIGMTVNWHNVRCHAIRLVVFKFNIP